MRMVATRRVLVAKFAEIFLRIRACFRGGGRDLDTRRGTYSVTY